MKRKKKVGLFLAVSFLAGTEGNFRQPNLNVEPAFPKKRHQKWGDPVVDVATKPKRSHKKSRTDFPAEGIFPPGIYTEKGNHGKKENRFRLPGNPKIKLKSSEHHKNNKLHKNGGSLRG